jgi:dihydrofolate reductase
VTRPRISVFVAQSLDGYIADENGALDWLVAAAVDGEDYGYDAFMSDVDALAMGRGTYDVVAGLAELPYGDRPVYVSTTRHVDARDRVVAWSCTPQEAVVAWEAAGLRHVYVDGGILIAAFLDAGLVDDLTITVVPLLLGSGIRLFPPVEVRTRLRLESATSHPSGMLGLRYTVVRDAPDHTHPG